MFGLRFPSCWICEFLVVLDNVRLDFLVWMKFRECDLSVSSCHWRAAELSPSSSSSSFFWFTIFLIGVSNWFPDLGLGSSVFPSEVPIFCRSELKSKIALGEVFGCLSFWMKLNRR